MPGKGWAILVSYVCDLELNPRFSLTFSTASGFYTPVDRVSSICGGCLPVFFLLFLQLLILWINEHTENYFSFLETPKKNLRRCIVHKVSWPEICGIIWNSASARCVLCSSMFMSHIYYISLKFSLWFSHGTRIKCTVWSAADWNCIRGAIIIGSTCHLASSASQCALQIYDRCQNVNIIFFGVMLYGILALVRSEALTLWELLWMLTNKLNMVAVL